MLEVFKTNVMAKDEANKLVETLILLYPDSKVNFDLEDIDNILRVEGPPDIISTVPKFMVQQGFECEALPD